MKKALWITAALLLVSLTGCSGSTEQEAKEISLPQPVIEESLTEAEPIAESETVSFSAGNEADETAENSEESKEPPTATVSEPEAEPAATEEAPQPTAPSQELKPTEPPRQEPQPTEPPQTEPTAPAPTEPPATEEPEPEPPEEIPTFDINDWISYAQGYASEVCLNLERSAVDCWDNPITAGPHSTCLKRDIESRLNRYSRDAEITDVWIWAEPHKDGSYDLYIGYS